MATQALNRLQDRKTLSDLVASELRERLISGLLPMGAELNQHALTQELGVSRAVVREAFRQLEAAGMIRLTPYHHAIVIPLSRDDLDDLWEIRVLLESLAAGRAAGRMTDETRARLAMLLDAMERETDDEAWLELDRRFHLAIGEIGGNPILPKLLEAVRTPINRFVKTASGARPRMSSANAEHRAILAALTQRDGMRAQDLLRRHIARTRQQLMSRLRESDRPVGEPRPAAVVRRGNGPARSANGDRRRAVR